MRLEVAQHSQLPFEQSVAVQRIRQVQGLWQELWKTHEKRIWQGQVQGFYGKGKGNPYKGYGKRSFWSDDLPQSFGDYYVGSYLMNRQLEPFHFKDGASTIPSTTSIIKMDLPEKEEILFKKKVKFEEHPPAEDQGEQTVKLNFPECHTDNIDNYHVVRGERICGLLVESLWILERLAG